MDSVPAPAPSMSIDFHGWNSQIPITPQSQPGQPSGLPNNGMLQQHNIPADSFYDSSVDLEQIIRTGAVASSNRDSPFLSASEAHWLFNNEGQRSASMSQMQQEPEQNGMQEAHMDPLPAFQGSENGAPHLPRSMSWPALNERRATAPKAAPYLAPLVPPIPKQVIFTPLAREKLLDYLEVCALFLIFSSCA